MVQGTGYPRHTQQAKQKGQTLIPTLRCGTCRGNRYYACEVRKRGQRDIFLPEMQKERKIIFKASFNKSN